MDITSRIKKSTQQALQENYQFTISENDILVNETKPEFEGDYTVVLFSLVKQLKKSPEVLGKELGDFLIQKHSNFFSSYNVIKGFLNLSVADNFGQIFFCKISTMKGLAKKKKTGKE